MPDKVSRGSSNHKRKPSKESNNSSAPSLNSPNELKVNADFSDLDISLEETIDHGHKKKVFTRYQNSKKNYNTHKLPDIDRKNTVTM